MKVFFHAEEDQIILMARMESDDGTIIGDFSDALGPEEELYGLTFEELAAAAPGSFDVGEDGLGIVRKDARRA